MITIKKYPNRRLYNTEESKYINLEAIKQLINDRVEFEVVDSKTKEVITKSILLQIITESEGQEGQSLLTDKLLQQLIRFYDSDMTPLLRQYLEQSMLSFLDQQDQMQGLMKNMVEHSPLGMMQKMMDGGFPSWPPKNK